MNAYPKPSDIGGTMIRKVMALFKERSFSLPISSPLFIATSGGVDSMVLAHLISKYGRKVVASEQITLLHFDHQWRTESSTVEKETVRSWAEQLGVKFLTVRLDHPHERPLSVNWEEDARLKRNEFYASQGSSVSGALIFTAHHSDDVVETLVWRFFRGELFEQNEGILFQDNNVLRPFLKVSKEEIYAYAQAEQVPYHEDPGNQDSGQMRAFFRRELKPILLKQFPGFRCSILRYTALQSKALKKEPNN
jgi:tRNA(Ile)-lysidine synthase